MPKPVDYRARVIEWADMPPSIAELAAEPDPDTARRGTNHRIYMAECCVCGNSNAPTNMRFHSRAGNVCLSCWEHGARCHCGSGLPIVSPKAGHPRKKACRECIIGSTDDEDKELSFWLALMRRSNISPCGDEDPIGSMPEFHWLYGKGPKGGRTAKAAGKRKKAV